MHAFLVLILAQDSLGSRTLTSLTLTVSVSCLLGTGSEFEIMQQIAEVPTNDFGVLVIPTTTNRREARDADSKELGSEEEMTALLHSQDRQPEHTAQSFKARFLHPDHQRETRTSRAASEIGSYLFSVASVTDGATFGYL